MLALRLVGRSLRALRVDGTRLMSGAPACLPGPVRARCAWFRPGAARVHHTGCCRSVLQGALVPRLPPETRGSGLPFTNKGAGLPFRLGLNRGVKHGGRSTKRTWPQLQRTTGLGLPSFRHGLNCKQGAGDGRQTEMYYRTMPLGSSTDGANQTRGCHRDTRPVVPRSEKGRR